MKVICDETNNTKEDMDKRLSAREVIDNAISSLDDGSVCMMTEKEVIEKIRKCTTREKLFAVLEEASNNDMKFWGENNYKAARELIKHAEGYPETHYGPQHGHLSEEEMFYMDVEMFLTHTWEYGMELKALKDKAAFADTVLGNWDDIKKDLDEGKWDKYVTTDGLKGITVCETKIEQYKVYRVCPSDCAYAGYSLVAAKSAEEANKIIQDVRDSDAYNTCDSYAYSDVSEDDVIEELISTRSGIILQGFHYTGN